MYNISKFENIQHDIFNFNLKRKIIIEYITKNFLITDDYDIPEIHITENNIHDINNIVQNMKTNLYKLKQQLNKQSVNIPVPGISINRYINQYNITDNIFWGIGLENECYLQGKSKPILGKDIIPMLGKERYSVDYTANYNIVQVKNIMSYVYNSINLYNVSQMI